MLNRKCGPAVKGTFVTLVTIFFVSLTHHSIAGETEDARVQKTLVERTENFCKAVLPNWFLSETGIKDENVRSIVTDCYMGHARLAVLGIKSAFPLADTVLSEVPAALLRDKTGINLDIYRPLAGRELQTRVVEK